MLASHLVQGDGGAAHDAGGAQAGARGPAARRAARRHHRQWRHAAGAAGQRTKPAVAVAVAVAHHAAARPGLLGNLQLVTSGLGASSLAPHPETVHTRLPPVLGPVLGAVLGQLVVQRGRALGWLQRLGAVLGEREGEALGSCLVLVAGPVAVLRPPELPGLVRGEGDGGRAQPEKSLPARRAPRREGGGRAAGLLTSAATTVSLRGLGSLLYPRRWWQRRVVLLQPLLVAAGLVLGWRRRGRRQVRRGGAQADRAANIALQYPLNILQPLYSPA